MKNEYDIFTSRVGMPGLFEFSRGLIKVLFVDRVRVVFARDVTARGKWKNFHWRTGVNCKGNF